MGGQTQGENEKYDGGNLGHLSWLRLMTAKTFNEPIFEALWENDPEEIKALNELHKFPKMTATEIRRV